MQKLRARGIFLRTFPQATDVQTIDFLSLGQRLTSDGGDGGEQIDSASEFIANRAGRNTRTTHHTGHALAALEGRAFAIAQRTSRAAMMKERQPGAIVSSVDHVGVVREFQVINRLEQPPNLGVDVLDGVDVCPLGVRIAYIVRYIEWDVRHGVRDVHKKRFVLICFDEIDRLLCTTACDGALVDRQLDDFLILKQRGLPLGKRGLWVCPEDVHPLPTTARLTLVVRVIHVVGIRNTIVGIESIGRRQRFLVMPKVPFSETGGGIALTLQVISDGVLLSIQPLGRGREQHVLMHAHALGITTRQQRRARGRAHRRGHHKARELPSLFGNAIDVWCLDGLGTEAAQVTVPLVIGKNDYKVGLGGLQNSCG